MTHTRRVPQGTVADRAVGAALGSFAASVVREQTLDPVTTELVRLRCAHYHDCGT